ncbi:hypothetical protein [Sinorhizobium medicae]|uniref:hypothetical protein n=1 Tax=Sinorhizobium medicae TaxID=110321 RepID=UPI001F3176D9|nr:hypothetical protein [Sinorhizobium medicae]WQP40898.1 hypothetical protein U8C38_21480 [Sinorhizobium medicae]
MNKTIASFAAAAILLFTHAAPASANSLYRPSVMVTNDGFVQEVAHRHGFYVIRGVHHYNGYRGVVASWPPLLPGILVSARCFRHGRDCRPSPSSSGAAGSSTDRRPY